MAMSLVSLVIVGCGGGSGSGNSGSATTLTITSEVAPALVAFRDGVDAAWVPATMMSPTAFEAVVHGPYVVAIACVEVGSIAFIQVAQTPDDPHAMTGCGAAPTPTMHVVSGVMVQPGFAQLGDVPAPRSSVANWTFLFAIASGTYDLVATTDQAITVHRGIAVSADVALTPAVDVGVDGTALVGVGFSAPNAAADEVTSASVGLLGATNADFPARIYLGPLATAQVAPDSALIATDVQSVSVRASKAGAFRALRRPFRVGGDTAYLLPPGIGGAQWSTDGGQLTAHWTSLPPFDFLTISAGGNAVNGTAQVEQVASLSPHFVAMTGVTEMALGGDIPGFQPAWKLDLTALYSRDLTAQQGTEISVLTSSEVSEDINAVAAGDGAGLRAAPIGRGRLHRGLPVP